MSTLSILILPFFIFIIVLIVLDIAMVISLVRPGDERRQLIVWKASTYTLLGTVGSLILNIIENIINSNPMTVNPFTTLGATATIYFLLLLFFKKRYGG